MLLAANLKILKTPLGYLRTICDRFGHFNKPCEEGASWSRAVMFKDNMIESQRFFSYFLKNPISCRGVVLYYQTQVLLK